MADFQLTLNDQERQFLAALLGHALKQKRIEEHRTGFNSYRDIVVEEEHVLEALLQKLGELEMA